MIEQHWKSAPVPFGFPQWEDPYGAEPGNYASIESAINLAAIQPVDKR